jgi:hypothetical protein
MTRRSPSCARSTFPAGLFCCTTLRAYDPELDAWHCLWSDPLRHVYVSMTGRRQGEEIVNEGKEPPSLVRVCGEDQARGVPTKLDGPEPGAEGGRFSCTGLGSRSCVPLRLARGWLAMRNRPVGPHLTLGRTLSLEVRDGWPGVELCHTPGQD